MGLETGISEVNISKLDLLLISFGYGTSYTILETLLNFPFESFQWNAVGTNNSKVYHQVGLVSGHHLTLSILKRHIYIAATLG